MKTIGILLLLSMSCFAADDGKAVFERVCSKCHKLTSTLAQRNSRERWSTIVDDMVAKGAEATDAEIEQIIDYLAKNLGGKVNVNKATAEEIAGVLELPQPQAAAIVGYREKNGAFKSIEDLRKVPGFDARAVETKKDRLEF